MRPAWLYLRTFRVHAIRLAVIEANAPDAADCVKATPLYTCTPSAVYLRAPSFVNFFPTASSSVLHVASWSRAKRVVRRGRRLGVKARRTIHFETDWTGNLPSFSTASLKYEFRIDSRTFAKQWTGSEDTFQKMARRSLDFHTASRGTAVTLAGYAFFYLHVRFVVVKPRLIMGVREVI